MAARLALAFVVVVGSTAGAGADPSAPQIDPIHAQREDAQRIAQQHRQLDTAAGGGAALPPATPPLADPPTTYDQRLLVPGIALLGIGVVAGGAALIDGDNQTEETQNSLIATAAIAGGVGLVLVLASRKTAVTPTVTSHSAGLAISGRF